MVKWVLDTSVIVKWFLPEEDTEKAELYLVDLANGTGRGVVPSSFFYEMANVLWVRRRNGVDSFLARRIWKELLALPLEVAGSEETLPQAIDFAFQHEVAVYDAVFAVLAHRLGCDLITADRALWSKVHRACPWVKLL